MPPSRMRLAVTLAALCVSLGGCSKPEEIRTYTVEREAPPDANKSRMLGVIIPVGEGASRYIKFSGAIGPVSAVEPKFNEFVGTVHFPDVNAMPTYTVPAGWTENPPRQFVPKSFTVGPAGTPQVTLSEPIQGSLLDNVNRWRKEVGLKEVTEAALPTVVTEVDLGGTKAYRIDFRGPAAPGSGGPRMGMAPPR
jgi:hypothetical protein